MTQINYAEMLDIHRKNVQNEYKQIIKLLEKISIEHDNDKSEGVIYDIYSEHYPILKSMTYGTPEYISYEKNNFHQAHKLHANQRHHYNAIPGTITDVNLFDILELMLDSKASIGQYSPDDYNEARLFSNMIENGALDLDFNEVIRNTIDKIYELDRENNYIPQTHIKKEPK